ncbi:MAG: hypothetical protein PHE79_03780 [Eubacteriales bacterium]|nr:hypothetical protein [Eubacteriales bacterium]
MEMTDRELLERIAVDVSVLKTDVEGLKITTAKIETTLENEIKPKLDRVAKDVDEIKPKIEVLFDGHFQNADKLDRIEKQVSHHEEFIMKRVR